MIYGLSIRMRAVQELVLHRPYENQLIRDHSGQHHLLAHTARCRPIISYPHLMQYVYLIDPPIERSR
ncbi:hypothetical protein D3C80_2117690 [compost metagenome]